MKRSRYPPGWDEARVHRVLKHYEEEMDEEAVAEDESAYEDTRVRTMGVTVELVPTVRDLIARGKTGDDG